MNKQKSLILTFDKCIKSVHIQGTVYDGRQQAPCWYMWKEKEAPSSVQCQKYQTIRDMKIMFG